MLLSKSRLVTSGLAVAALGAVALGYAAPHVAFRDAVGPSITTQAAAADNAPSATGADTRSVAKVDVPRTQVAEVGRDVRVDAPHANVKVNKDTGRVAVRAPYTDVKVDPDKGRVRVRAPYVDLDIRW